MIIRRRHTANFTTIANVLFEDERLALDELGLMSWLRSRPDNWEVRRPALMRRFKIGRDGMRRILRNLLRFGWIGAQVTRSGETGRVYVIYEVRDEPGPELSEDEARAALSLVSSGAGPGEPSDDDGEGDGTDDNTEGADPPTGGGSPPTGEPEAARRLLESHPGYKKESLKTDSENTESPNGVRAFTRALARWPAEFVLSRVTAETAFVGLIEKDQDDCERGMNAYLSDCKNNSRKVCDLTTYIRERRWERFTSAKAASAKLVETKPGTPQWYRWRDYNKEADPNARRLMESWAQQNRSWWAPSEWPPGMPAREPSNEDLKDFTA